MARKIGIAVLVVLVLFVGVVSTRPDTFHIERSTRVAAPAQIVHAQINNFHRWAAWSPWDKMDPTMQRTYTPPDEGVGAAYAWVGNDKVGEGSMKITESTPPAKVVVALEFRKPFAASNVVTFTLVPDGAGTRVTWAMDGASNFAHKFFTLVMDMDKMVGGDFERGLASLKEVAEAQAKAPPPANPGNLLVPAPPAVVPSPGAPAVPAPAAPAPAPAAAPPTVRDPVPPSGGGPPG